MTCPSTSLAWRGRRAIAGLGTPPTHAGLVSHELIDHRGEVT